MNYLVSVFNNGAFKMRDDYRLIPAGGFGNQLFQLVFANFISQETGKRLCINEFSRNSPPHAQIRLSSYFKSSPYVYFQTSSMRFHNHFSDPWGKYHVSKRRNLSDTRAEPFLSVDRALEEIRTRKSFVGYFQNKSFLLSIGDKFIDSIFHLVGSSSIVDRLNLKEFDVVHVRGGDVTTDVNRKRIGVISHDYYEKLWHQLESKETIVVTDDPVHTKNLLRNLGYKYLLGPSDTSVLDVLKLMSRARTLIAANSTLSWWGGVMVMSNKGKVIFPKPIFRSKELFSDEKLDFPGFTITESIFEI